MPALQNLRTRPKLWASAALVTAGLAGGAILGATMSASASTSTTTNSTGSTGSSSGTSHTGSSNPPAAPAYPGLPRSGTVTAVGTNTVTIDGTTYAVTSNSDIDKNGEATLKDLVVGDKVTFSTVASASTPTIDKLHAGNEALDRPTGPPPGASNGMSGAPYGTPPRGGAGQGSAPSSNGGTIG